MATSYDPDRAPEISSEVAQYAAKSNLHLVNVICTPPGARVGEQSGLSFLAAVSFVPRQGDRITLEDGTRCDVHRVYFRTVTMPIDEDGNTVAILVPNVYAIEVEPD